jgi:urease accessory protein
LANLGGGLVDGDCIAIDVDVGEGAAALLGTQASTKIYRSPRGCAQLLNGRVSKGGVLAILPDPVVCFAGARYVQSFDLTLAPGASVILLDGYTCGRSARGERWEFLEYASTTRVTRDGGCIVVDATRLDSEPGPIAKRMGRFDVVFTLLAIGPHTAPVREAFPEYDVAPRAGQSIIAAWSPIGTDGAILRMAAQSAHSAMEWIRRTLVVLVPLLGDDPFARKW